MKTAIATLFWPLVGAALIGYLMFNVYTQINVGMANANAQFQKAMAQSMTFKR